MPLLLHFSPSQKSVGQSAGAAPLVVGDTMYVVTPYPNILYALDLKNSGSVKWKYEPKPAAAAQGVACCDYVNRGCFYYEGKLYYNTLVCHVVCVDAATGKEDWKTKVGEINVGETMTMAPLVVKGKTGNAKVLVGNSGGEFGVRGRLTALDAKAGAMLWRAYSSGPDADCHIGPNVKPYYATDKGQDLGVKTGPPAALALGRRGLAINVVGYTLYGDYREPNPPARIIEAAAAGEVDVAVVWGPMAGYFAKNGRIPLDLAFVSPAVEPPGLPMTFAISVGVKKGVPELKAEVAGVLARRRADIQKILDEYCVPRVSE